MPISVAKLLTVCATVFLLALCGAGITSCTYQNIERSEQKVECVKLGRDPDSCRRLFYDG